MIGGVRKPGRYVSFSKLDCCCDVGDDDIFLPISISDFGPLEDFAGDLFVSEFRSRVTEDALDVSYSGMDGVWRGRKKGTNSIHEKKIKGEGKRKPAMPRAKLDEVKMKEEIESVIALWDEERVEKKEVALAKQ